MPDSVSSIVGFCHSRIAALLPRVLGPKRRLSSYRRFANPEIAARLCDLNMLSGYDNFQSYFLIRSISGTYRVVSLRQLRYLESLAETRHFGHAAEACAVSQPALSMQIKELEDELKVSLVERRKSGIEF